jgi:hypothetical protein
VLDEEDTAMCILDCGRSGMLMSIATGYEGRNIYMLLCTENGYNFDILLQAAGDISRPASLFGFCYKIPRGEDDSDSLLG